jgi:hypothetical protein
MRLASPEEQYAEQEGYRQDAQQEGELSLGWSACVAGHVSGDDLEVLQHVKAICEWQRASSREQYVFRAVRQARPSAIDIIRGYIHSMSLTRKPFARPPRFAEIAIVAVLSVTGS